MRHISFKTFDCPFVGAHLHEIDLFAPQVQAGLLGLRGELRKYNEVINDVREFAAKTFDASLSADNRQALIENLRVAETTAGSVAERIADKIHELLRQMNTSLNGPTTQTRRRLVDPVNAAI